MAGKGGYIVIPTFQDWVPSPKNNSPNDMLNTRAADLRMKIRTNLENSWNLT